jgi:hypothetical protein
MTDVYYMLGIGIGRLSRSMSHNLRDSKDNGKHQSTKLNNIIFLPNKICPKIPKSAEICKQPVFWSLSF